MPRGLPPHPVLAADTTVVLDGEILGKPADAAHAMAMLRPAVRTHAPGADRGRGGASATTWRRALSRLDVSSSATSPTVEIRRYVATGEPLDKAGAYAIQGRAAVFVAPDRRQLFRHHGTAAVRNGRAAAAVRHYLGIESRSAHEPKKS